MRTAVISTVGASVSFFVPGADLAVQPALQPAVQPAFLQPAFLQPAAQTPLQPAFLQPDTIRAAPEVVAIPSAQIVEDANEGPRWFVYGFFAAVLAMAARSRLQLSTATLATAGQVERTFDARAEIDAFAEERRKRLESLITVKEATRVAHERMSLFDAEQTVGPDARAALDAFAAKRGNRLETFVMQAPISDAVWADSYSAALERARRGAAATDPAPSISTDTQGVVVPSAAPKPKASKKPKRDAWKEGIFAPAVLGAKAVMGEQQLKELRASVITKHSKVIADFVDTSESAFGQLVLQRMFDYADKDGNGTLDKEELRSALFDLGFDFLDEKQVDKIMNNADKDKNDVIDFEEFVKATPKSLRTNLVKLAKKNGHDLGFLV
jgi:hypothetical protein